MTAPRRPATEAPGNPGGRLLPIWVLGSVVLATFVLMLGVSFLT